MCAALKQISEKSFSSALFLSFLFFLFCCVADKNEAKNTKHQLGEWYSSAPGFCWLLPLPSHPFPLTQCRSRELSTLKLYALTLSPISRSHSVCGWVTLFALSPSVLTGMFCILLAWKFFKGVSSLHMYVCVCGGMCGGGKVRRLLNDANMPADELLLG